MGRAGALNFGSLLPVGRCRPGAASEGCRRIRDSGVSVTSMKQPRFRDSASMADGENDSSELGQQGTKSGMNWSDRSLRGRLRADRWQASRWSEIRRLKETAPHPMEGPEIARSRTRPKGK